MWDANHVANKPTELRPSGHARHAATRECSLVYQVAMVKRTAPSMAMASESVTSSMAIASESMTSKRGKGQLTTALHEQVRNGWRQRQVCETAQCSLGSQDQRLLKLTSGPTSQLSEAGRSTACYKKVRKSIFR
jgi:hypothetical protein